MGINKGKPQHARKHEKVNALGGLLRAPGGLAKTSYIPLRKRPGQETHFLGRLFSIEKTAPFKTLDFGTPRGPPKGHPGTPQGGTTDDFWVL